MKICWIPLIIISLISLTESSLINDFFMGARNLWPRAKEVSNMNQLKDFPQVQFEISKENDEFLKQGLDLINAPKEALDLCSHRVILTLKKKCNQLSLEEIGKLSILLMNCQLEAERRSTYPCKPEMTLAQCTMGFDNSINHLYHVVSQRALSVCSAIKQQHLQMFTEMAINRLMQLAQKQTTSIHESLQNQKRINEMGIQNIQEYNENYDKIKETQIQNIEILNSAKEQIIELNSDLQRQLEIHQLSEQKLMNIEKTAEEIAKNLETTNIKIVQHYNEAMQFMVHFRNIMEMIAVITSAIERVFEKIKEIAKEIGLDISQDTAINLIINLVYFVCGMVFMLFVNMKRKYKKILIILFVFNSAAAFSQSEIALLPINILIWISVCCYNLSGTLKHKLFMTIQKFSWFMKIKDENKSDVRHRMSRKRSITPLVTPKKVQKQNKVSKGDTSDEDSEIADICEKEMMLLSEDIPEVPAKTISSTIQVTRPETPSNRPMTPAMMRVLQVEGMELPRNRVGTPFQAGLLGRIQCQATTNKGAQCRNAAIIGYSKCKVHNYE